jgi:hypothetical protein
MTEQNNKINFYTSVTHSWQAYYSKCESKYAAIINKSFKEIDT